jgi:hypothetical protein
VRTASRAFETFSAAPAILPLQWAGFEQVALPTVHVEASTGSRGTYSFEEAAHNLSEGIAMQVWVTFTEPRVEGEAFRMEHLEARA